MRNLVIGMGVLVIVVSVFADALGLGVEPRFGWKQWIGLAAGIVLAVWDARRGRASR